MKTLPAYMVPHGRGGAPFIYLLDIIPRGSDAWSTYRWSELAITIAGNDYEAGVLAEDGAGNITDKVAIEHGGNAASVDSVRLKLLDKVLTGANANGSPLRQHLIDNDLEGRDVQLYGIFVPPNLLINSSFEARTGNDFDNWTETPNDGTILASTGFFYHKAVGAFLSFAAGSTGPWVDSDTMVFYQGQAIVVSVYAKGLSGGEDFVIDFGGSSLYWNIATQQFEVSPAVNRFTLPGDTDWHRFEFLIPASAWVPLVGLETANWFVRFGVPDVGDTVVFDAGQVEVSPRGGVATPYQVHKDELEATDLFKLYRGEMRRPSWKHGDIRIETTNVVSKRHRDIPIGVIRPGQGKTGEYWDVPPENNGKPFPITLGDMYFRVFGDNVQSAGGTVDRIPLYACGEYDPFAFAYAKQEVVPNKWPRSLAMGRLVNLGNLGRPDESPPIVHFDRPGIKLFDIGLLYHYTGDANRYLQEWPKENYPSAPTYDWLKYPDDARAVPDLTQRTYITGQRMPLVLYMRPQAIIYNTGAAGDEVIDPHAILHGNFFPYAYSNSSNPVAGEGLMLQFDIFTLQDCQLIDAYLLQQSKILAGATGASTIELSIGDASGFTVYPLIVGPGLVRINNCPWTCDDAADPPTASETSMKVAVTSNTSRLDWWQQATDTISAPPTHYKRIDFFSESYNSVRLHDFGIRLDLTMSLEDWVPFAACKGREYQDTWNGRKTATALIENLADFIEAIERQELGTPSADIDETGFDAANAARSTWKGAGQVTETEESLNVIEDIAFSGALIYFADPDGLSSVRALGYSATPDKLLSMQRDFRDKSIQVTYTRRENVVNEFILHYGRNAESDEYMAEIFCNRKTTDVGDIAYVLKCAESYELLGQEVYRKEFFAPWIQDRATAIELMKFLVDWLRLRRIRVKGDSWLEQLGIELGDMIQLYDGDGYLPDTLLNATRFVVDVRALKKKTAEIGLGLLEVRNPQLGYEDHYLVDRAYLTALECRARYIDASGNLHETILYPDTDVTTDWNKVPSAAANHYETIDESLATPDDSDYCWSNTDTDWLTVTFSNLPGAAVTVAGVEFRFRGQMNERSGFPGNYSEIQCRPYQSGGAALGAGQNLTPAAFGGDKVLGWAGLSWDGTYFVLGGAAWTAAAINNMELRMQYRLF